MRLCLAGTFPSEKIVRANRPEYVLESFYYIKPWQIEEMPRWKMFLLDSGAFTFMHGIEASSKPVDWNGYLSRYIAFINRYGIENFFELDVDAIIGYDAVKRMRARLEAETGEAEHSCLAQNPGLGRVQAAVQGISLHRHRRFRNQAYPAQRVRLYPAAGAVCKCLRGAGAWFGVHQEGCSGLRFLQCRQHDMDNTGQFRRAVLLQRLGDGSSQTTQGDDWHRPPHPQGVFSEGMAQISEIP